MLTPNALRPKAFPLLQTMVSSKKHQGEILNHFFFVTVPLVEFMYLVFTGMPGESYRRWLRPLLLCLCYVFRALINSHVCWFISSFNKWSQRSMSAGSQNDTQLKQTDKISYASWIWDGGYEQVKHSELSQVSFLERKPPWSQSDGKERDTFLPGNCQILCRYYNVILHGLFNFISFPILLQRRPEITPYAIAARTNPITD